MLEICLAMRFHLMSMLVKRRRNNLLLFFYLTISMLLPGGYASNGALQSDGDLTNTTVSVDDLYSSYHLRK